MKESIYCIADPKQAHQIIEDLHAAHISDDHISVLYSEQARKEELYPSQERSDVTSTLDTDAPETDFTTRSMIATMDLGTTDVDTPAPRTREIDEPPTPAGSAATGSLAGGALGGTLGLIAGMGTIAIPGLGPLVAAGPIMSTLTGTAIGGGIGGTLGFLGGLIGSDPAQAADQRTKGVAIEIEKGGVLIGVDVDSDEQSGTVRMIFRKDGARDIRSLGDYPST